MLRRAWRRAWRDKRLTGRALRKALNEYDDDNAAAVWTWIPAGTAVIEDARRRLEVLKPKWRSRAQMRSTSRDRGSPGSMKSGRPIAG